MEFARSLNIALLCSSMIITTCSYTMEPTQTAMAQRVAPCSLLDFIKNPKNIPNNLAYKDQIEKLLAHNADVNYKGEDGKTPLIIAAENCRISEVIIDTLLAHNANPTDSYQGQESYLFASNVQKAWPIIVSKQKYLAAKKPGKTYAI